MSQVIVFPRGQLSELDKARMQEAGIIAVEADDPSKVISILPNPSILNGDDMLMSLLAGVNAPNYESAAAVAVSTLHKRLKEREAKQESTRHD